MQNSNLWKCRSDNWHQLPPYPTNLAVYRSIAFAYDYNCYMAFNCGDRNVPCNLGQSIYQDVRASDYGFTPGRQVTFGGQFAIYQNTPNSLQVVTWQLDASERAITNSAITVSLTDHYQLVQGKFTVVSGCAWVRFQLYPKTPGISFRADDLFLRLV